VTCASPSGGHSRPLQFTTTDTPPLIVTSWEQSGTTPRRALRSGWVARRLRPSEGLLDIPPRFAADLQAPSGPHPLVDLDAARRFGDTRPDPIYPELLSIKVQVRRRIRTAETVDSCWTRAHSRDHGGTVAVRDPRLLEPVRAPASHAVWPALDVSNNKAALMFLPTEPIVIGSLSRENGTASAGGCGPDSIDYGRHVGRPPTSRRLKKRARLPASRSFTGGITTVGTIKVSPAAGAQAVILGKALYEGGSPWKHAPRHVSNSRSCF